MVQQRWGGGVPSPWSLFSKYRVPGKNCNLFIFRTPFSIEMAMLEKIVKNSVLVVFNSNFGEF